MLALLPFAFLAGVLTIASPCVLPVLPILLSGTVGGRARPYGILLGFLASFVAFTLFLSSLTRLLGVPADVLRGLSIGLLIVFGLALAVPGLNRWYERLSSRLISGTVPNVSSPQRPGFAGGVMVGATLGLLWTPCVGPILASVITLAASGSVTLGAATVTLAYALGAAGPMLAIMLGGRQVLGRVPWLLSNLGGVQRGFGALMIVFALAMFWGADRQLQSWFLDTFPGYASGLFAVEERGAVQRELPKLAEP